MIRYAKRPRPQCVAIVDDDALNRAGMGQTVTLAGYSPLLLEGTYSSPAQLLKVVTAKKVFAVICDHRLNEGNYANFYGAQAVAELYDAEVPALLVTEYTNVDINSSIRRYRRRIPHVIRTSDADPKTLLAALAMCENEVRRKEIPLARRPRRAIVMIDEIRQSPNGEEEVVAFVPQWNSREAVCFPAALVPQAMRFKLKKGEMLLASVNIDTESGDDLFFADFEVPPDEDPLNEKKS